MDFGEFVEGIEKLIVRILLWVVIIPKTLFQIMTEPGWVVGYIDKEMSEGASDKGEQFDDFMSPIMLFLICSLVLFVLLGSVASLDSIFDNLLGSGNGRPQSGNNNPSDIVALMESVQGVNGFLSALAFLSLPLIFALAIEYFGRRKIIRAQLVRTLNIQCYFFSPLTLSIFSSFIISSLLSESYDGGWIITSALFIVLGTVIWFLIVQVQFIKDEIGGHLLKSATILVGCATFSIVITGLIFSLLNQSSLIDWALVGEPETIDWTLPADGTYTIEVSGYGDNQYGDYQLILESENSENYSLSQLVDTGDSSSGNIAYNEIIAAEFTGEERVQWNFVGSAGDIVDIYAYPDFNFDVMIQVLNNEQQVVADADEYAQGDYEEILAFELPESGQYSILIDGYEGSTGQFELEIIDSNSFVETVIFKDTGNSPSGSLAYNEFITAEFTGNEDVLWGFEGVAGDVIDIFAVPYDDFDVMLQILDPQQEVIDQIDEYGDGEIEAFFGFELPESGQYSILIDGYEGSTGQFNLELINESLFEFRDADSAIGEELTFVSEFKDTGNEISGSLAINQYITAEFTGEADVRWDFEGSAGEAVDIYAYPYGNFDVMFQVVDEENKVIADIDEYGGGDVESFIGLELAESGQYSILINGYEGSTGEFDLEVVRSTAVNLFEISDSSEAGNVVGSISFGQFVNSSFSEGESVKWQFEGNENDTFTLTIVPDANFDPVFDVVDKDGVSLFGSNNEFVSLVLAAIYVVLIGLALLLGMRSIWRSSRGNRRAEAGETETAVPELAEDV